MVMNTRHILLVQELCSGAIFAVDSRGYVSERMYWLGGHEPPPAWEAQLRWSHYEPERWNAVRVRDPAEYRVLATAPAHEGDARPPAAARRSVMPDI